MVPTGLSTQDCAAQRHQRHLAPHQPKIASNCIKWFSSSFFLFTKIADARFFTWQSLLLFYWKYEFLCQKCQISHVLKLKSDSHPSSVSVNLNFEQYYFSHFPEIRVDVGRVKLHSEFKPLLKKKIPLLQFSHCIFFDLIDFILQFRRANSSDENSKKVTTDFGYSRSV